MFDRMSRRIREARNARRAAQMLSDRNDWNDRFAPRHIDEVRSQQMMRRGNLW